MILHDWRCPDGHVFEELCNWNDESKRCPECGQNAAMVFLPRRRDAVNFAPVVYFKGKDGKLRFPGRADAPTPKGYERVELRSASEVRSFERHVNARELSRFHEKQERQERYYSEVRKSMRSELIRRSQSFSLFGRDLVRAAIERSNSARRGKFDAGFHVEAFSYNSSNRQPFCDRDTGLRDKR